MDKIKTFSFILAVAAFLGLPLSNAFAFDAKTFAIYIMNGSHVETINYTLQTQKSDIVFSSLKKINYVKAVKDINLSGQMGGGGHVSKNIMGNASYGVKVLLHPVSNFKHVYTFSVEDKSFDSMLPVGDGSQRPVFSGIKATGTVTLLRGKNTIQLGDGHSMVVVVNPAT